MRIRSLRLLYNIARRLHRAPLRFQLTSLTRGQQTIGAAGDAASQSSPLPLSI
ncbi:hypothetical protein PLANPX_3177 [Lacipirellula parvula]|uniref:Uncharacterized protein n=1 Tax=Lacipirellula parvula TaxID=2650471 RepID=A0A5K7XAZ3_9BACT|nr:hypothetical protein PLANPX_3177 [Lacipirellula parvula]